MRAMKKTISLAGLVGAFGFAAAALAAAPAIDVIECKKCPMRMKFAADGKNATINKCRLTDDNPDAAELARRLDAMKARAEKLLVKDDPNAGALTRPLMGWSSWNTFRVNISPEIILGVARVMATNGLKAAGYTYINTDDGFFGGRDKDGKLLFHKERFPNGLKGMVDGIHALGFKAGIYSEAGADTCGSMYDADKAGVGSGLYGHDAEDFKLFFNDLGFDFIKIDYCGGKKLKLNERARYTEIAHALKATGRTDVRLNMCRWAFPGTWAADVAGSWRTTPDLHASWNSVKRTILKNLYLSAYVKPGRYNDLDMLVTGRLRGAGFQLVHPGENGLTREEERTHFGLWCIMSSPLLIGCDPRAMPQGTFDLMTNPYLLAMNQNDLGLQAYVAARAGDAYVLVKDADERFGTARYVALLNLGGKPARIAVRARDLDLAGRIDVLDLVERADPGCFADQTIVEVPAHGAKFYRFDAEKRLDRAVYEAETAYLSDFNDLGRNDGSAFCAEAAGASGGVLVRRLGGRESNDLVWKDVRVSRAGEYELALDYAPGGETRFAFLQIDGGERIRFETKAGTTRVVLPVTLSAGVHAVRLSNPTAGTADFDRMTLAPKAVPRDLHLILCIGQSNMAGRGAMTDADREPVANAFKFDRDNRWMPACAPYHFDKTVAAVGPVDGFVKRYLADHPGVSVGVVPCAVGGSGVSSWSASRSGKKGKNLVTALARAQAASSNGTFVAVLWHQGETDAAKWDVARIAERYPGSVASVAQAVRAVVGAEVPFIAGEIGRWMRKDGDHAGKINPAIRSLPQRIARCAVVSSEGLNAQDAHHFDREGQRVLGERYYEAWKELAGNAPAVPVRDLQAEINALAAAGGGTLSLTAGVYRTGALFFKSGVNLHLAKGATILGVDDGAAYPMRETRIEGETCFYYPALLNADGCDGFTISGEGAVDGHGLPTWKEFWTLRKRKPECTNKELMRPRLLYVSNSKNVDISGVTFKNSKFWTTHFYRCENLRIHDCEIVAEVLDGVRGPSTDAIDLDVCRGVLVSNVVMNVNDDSVVIKGGKGPWADDYAKHPENGPSSDVLITDCTFKSVCHSCLTLGSECPAATNIVMRNCRLEGAGNLLFLKLRTDTPQRFADVRVENVIGSCKRILLVKPWGQFADLKDRTTPLMSEVDGVTLRDCTLDAKTYKAVTARPKQYRLKNLRFENMTVNGERQPDEVLFRGADGDNASDD